jgi:hypothetical protein
MTEVYSSKSLITYTISPIMGGAGQAQSIMPLDPLLQFISSLLRPSPRSSSALIQRQSDIEKLRRLRDISKSSDPSDPGVNYLLLDLLSRRSIRE